MTQTAPVTAPRPIPSEFSTVQPQSSTSSGDSTSCIAHDLNNSVQATLSTLQLLQGYLRRGLTDEISRLIDQAAMSAALASKTSRRLMDASQSKRGVGTTFAVKDLVATMEPILKHALGSSSELVLNFVSSSPVVTCDPSRLQNALLNLVLNARDAIQHGGTVIVSVSHGKAACASVGDCRNYVRISIADNGHGMTQDVLGRVCTAFFTTKPPGEGSGLGLLAVKSFADELGGCLDIQSTPGCGTSVSIFLPCEEA